VQCNLCCSENILLKFTKRYDNKYWRIYECQECQVEYVCHNYSQEEVLEIQKSYFNLNNTSTDNSIYWKNELAIIMAIGYNSGAILDVGCNDGQFLSICSTPWKRYGIELSTAGDLAREKGITVINKEITEYKFPDNFFDVVTMFAVIEHLKDPKGLLKEINRILKPDGLVVIMTGDKNSFKARTKGENWHMYCPPIHLWFFSRKSLDLLAESCGFKSIYHRYTSGGMYWSKNRLFQIIEKCFVKSIFEKWFKQIPFYDHLYAYYRKEQ